MHIYRIDPLRDPRWPELVEHHPQASVFHTVKWLQALRLTYGFDTVAFTTSPPKSELENGILFCQINSWLTGHRLVSLPFSDHCEPLCSSTEELDFLVRYLQAMLEHENWKYMEIRPINGNFSEASGAGGFVPAGEYLFHALDLQKPVDELLRGFDKDSIQRRIRRANRSELEEKRGRSADLLKDFYRLFVMTRRRHRLPPIPYAWFQNLLDAQGDAAEIRMCYKDGIPIAAILNLQFRSTVYYKYGCSDSRWNKFGATPWLLWRSIIAAKERGATQFDLGRTETDNHGLIAFKNHWVPQPVRLVYWGFPRHRRIGPIDPGRLNLAKRVFSLMPNALLRLTGRVLYPHIG